jgi:hypothetical protein
MRETHDTTRRYFGVEAEFRSLDGLALLDVHCVNGHLMRIGVANWIDAMSLCASNGWQLELGAGD